MKNQLKNSCEYRIDEIDGKKTLQIKPTEGLRARIEEGLGANEALRAELTGHIWRVVNGGRDFDSDKFEAAIRLLAGFSPKNEKERLLAVQAVSLHFLVMKFMERASIGVDVDVVQLQVNRIAKLMRAFDDKIRLIDQLQNGRVQKITVEKVEVAAGGQAVVGIVSQK